MQDILRESSVQLPADLPDQLKAGKPLPEEAQKLILQALSKTVEYMQKTFGKVEVPWGEVCRGKRGDRSWPLAGFVGNGLATLRAVSGELKENGITYIDHGQSCPTLVFLKQPISSYSALPYGESEDPNSPHYTDQGEKLFSKGVLKPTWYQKEELLKNLESSREMELDN